MRARLSKLLPEILLITSLLIYVIYRASTLSFTHDESLSFTIIKGNLDWVLTANNHLLNTQLMSIFSRAFGDSELSLRLPNVLSFLLYSFFCLKILQLTKNRATFLIGIAICLLNPYLIEFFSLARGYGLALAFMTASMFYFLKSSFTSYWNPRIYTRIMLFALLSLASSFGLINFVIALLFISCTKFLVDLRSNPMRSSNSLISVLILLTSLTCVVLAVSRLLELKNLGELYYGIESFRGSVHSLVQASNGFSENANTYTQGLKWMIIISAVVMSIWVFIKKDLSSPFGRMITLVAVLVFGLFLEFWIFEAKFPVGRTALFLIPLLGFTLAHFMARMELGTSRKKTFLWVLTLCLLCLSSVNFLVGSNVSYSSDWNYDAFTSDAIEELKRKTLNRETPASLSCNWLFSPSLNYYIETKNLKLTKTDKSGISSNSDYIYALGNDSVPAGFKRIQSFGDNSSVLYEKLHN